MIVFLVIILAGLGVLLAINFRRKKQSKNPLHQGWIGKGTSDFNTLIVCLLVYVLLNLAFQFCLPRKFDEAWSGWGWWLDQILLIGIILTVAFVKEKKLEWISGALGAAAIFVFIFSIIYNWPSKPKSDVLATTEQLGKSQKDSLERVKTLQMVRIASYDSTYILKLGEVLPPIKVPIGYDVLYSDPGEPFCRQTDGNPRDTIGGGFPFKRQSTHTTTVQLSPLYKTVKVTAYFSPQKPQFSVR
jgi:hypothetical protein